MATPESTLAALTALQRGERAPAIDALEQALLSGALPSTAEGLYDYFTWVWKRYAKPVIRAGADPHVTIPAGPWGPAARVWLVQPWVRWGAITIGPDIFVPSRDISEGLLVHEYTHTLQCQQAGGFPTYLRLWAVLTARYGYREGQLEQEAYAAPARHAALLREYGVPERARREKRYGPGDTWHPAHAEYRPGGSVLTYRGVEYPRPKVQREIRGTSDPHVGVTRFLAGDFYDQGEWVVPERPGQRSVGTHSAGRQASMVTQRIVAGADDLDLDMGAESIQPSAHRVAGGPGNTLDDRDRFRAEDDGYVHDSVDPAQADLGLIQQPARDPDLPF